SPESLERGAAIAARIGLSPRLQNVMRSFNERWDGQGGPCGLAGNGIPLISRIVSLAHALAAAYRSHGPAASIEMARSGSGVLFDPSLTCAAESLARRGHFWQGMEDARRRLQELEPGSTALPATEATVDAICQAFGEVADARSQFVYRHSDGV